MSLLSNSHRRPLCTPKSGRRRSPLALTIAEMMHVAEKIAYLLGGTLTPEDRVLISEIQSAGLSREGP